MNICANCAQVRCEDKKFVIVFMDDLETMMICFNPTYCASKLFIYSCVHLCLWPNCCFFRIIVPRLSPVAQGVTSWSLYIETLINYENLKLPSSRTHCPHSRGPLMFKSPMRKKPNLFPWSSLDTTYGVLQDAARDDVSFLHGSCIRPHLLQL
jgi:hypothetical protein